MIAEFFGTLTASTDGFFDDPIWNAELHEIRRGDEVCGLSRRRTGCWRTISA